MPQQQQVTIQGYVAKSLPDGFDAAKDGLWGVATIERKDLINDVVLVAGVDWTKYHDPPRSYLKVLAQHMKVGPDGSPTVIGRVEEFHKAKLAGDDALLFRMSWAKDGEGNITPLARKYKDLYDGGYLDSFSIGFRIREADVNRDGGLLIKSSDLFEVSCVSIPMLAGANAIRAVKEALGDDLEIDVERATERAALLKDITDLLDARVSAIARQVSALKAMTEARLDELEAALVSEPDDAGAAADRDEPASAPAAAKSAAAAADLSAIARALEGLSQALGA